MAVDGFDWDLPDTEGNVVEFGYGGAGATRSVFPKARVVTVSECASHAVVAAGIGGANTAEQKLPKHANADSFASSKPSATRSP
jgi:hypothetical protein